MTNEEPPQLERRMSTELGELATALAEAQGEFQSVHASRKGRDGNRKYSYADLDAFFDVCRPILSKKGLAIVQRPLPTDGSTIWLETMLIHKSGQWIGGELVIRPSDTTPKAVGSAITYARRYSLQSMLGLSATEDDDGQAASSEPAKKSTRRVTTQGPRATKSDAQVIRELCKNLQIPPERIQAKLAQLGAKKLTDLSAEEAQNLRRHLEKKDLERQGAAAF